MEKAGSACAIFWELESWNGGRLQILKVLVLFLFVATAVIHEPKASPLESVIPVVYRSQETGDYCGPAVVQMALSARARAF